MGGQRHRAPMAPLPSPGSWFLCTLGGVDNELLWTAGQKKSCKQPGFAYPHVQALLSEGDHCLGDRGPEKALVVQGRYGENTMIAAARCALSRGPAPQTRKH